MSSNPLRAIPKALKMVPVATLLGAQFYKASLLPNIATFTQREVGKKF